MRFSNDDHNNYNDNHSNLALDRLKQFLNNKVKEKKNQIHPLHAKVYNDNLQIEIHSLRWILERAMNQRQINQVRCLVENEINNLGIKMKNSRDMEERDVLITEVEILLWILYVIQSIEEEKGARSDELII
jgi:prenyltransferase beta subunit